MAGFTTNRFAALTGRSQMAGRLAAPAFSVAVLGGAVFELHVLDWSAVLAVMPRTPLFWLVFVLAYLVPPVADWCIYRQVWSIPHSALVAMIRKTVSNDLLIGYIGETYLYTWARRAGHGAAAAFGTVKDVSILSAAAGSGAALVVVAFTAPLLAQLDLHLPFWSIVAALVAILVPPAVAILGGRRMFHLPPAIRGRIAAIHALRSTGGIVLTAVLWHLALPHIALDWWVVLSALKVALSRLPLASNKDLVFAGTIAVLLGHHGEVPALMAMMASLTVAAHIAVGLAALAGGGLHTAARRLRLNPALSSATG